MVRDINNNNHINEIIEKQNQNGSSAIRCELVIFKTGQLDLTFWFNSPVHFGVFVFLLVFHVQCSVQNERS
jgi:hypothetical protein